MAEPHGPSLSSASARQRIREGGCLGAFFGVFLLVGFGFSLFFLIPLWRTWESRDWRQTPCRILHSAVRTHPSTDSDSSDTYSVDVAYTYVVDGREYRSTRYRFLTGSSSGYDGKAAAVARYPAGSEAVCWVHPDDPTWSVLARKLSWDYLVVLVPLLFMAVGIGGLAAAFGRLLPGRRR